MLKSILKVVVVAVIVLCTASPATALVGVVDEVQKLTSIEHDAIAEKTYPFPAKLIVTNASGTAALGNLAASRTGEDAVVIAWSPANHLVSVRAGRNVNVDPAAWDRIAAAGTSNFRVGQYEAAIADVFNSAAGSIRPGTAGEDPDANLKILFYVVIVVIVIVVLAWLFSQSGGGGGYSSSSSYVFFSSDSGSSGGSGSGGGSSSGGDSSY